MLRGDVRVMRGWRGLVKALVKVSSGRRMTDFMVSGRVVGCRL